MNKRHEKRHIEINRREEKREETDVAVKRSQPSSLKPPGRRTKTNRGDGTRVDACRPIWEAMWAGQTCYSACRELGGRNGVPAWSTLKEWIRTDPVIAAHYARAREAWTDYHLDAMLEIADRPLVDETVTTQAHGAVEVKRCDLVNRRRLQIDARKWIVARAAPKKP
jgi:hypothetical protein